MTCPEQTGNEPVRSADCCKLGDGRRRKRLIRFASEIARREATTSRAEKFATRFATSKGRAKATD